MRQRELLRRIAMAAEKVDAEIAANARSLGGGIYSRGMSGEGYAGGYMAALQVVRAMITTGEPHGDHRGYWRDERK